MAMLVPVDFGRKQEQINQLRPLFGWANSISGMMKLMLMYSTSATPALDAYIRRIYKNMPVWLNWIKYLPVTKQNNHTSPAFFTSNDENSWNGSEYEKYSSCFTLAVFSCTWDGVPLLYSGRSLIINARIF
jgi:hypothetical protein